MSPPRLCPKKRILERHRVVGDCWIWTGSKTKDGYGVMGVGRGFQKRAHRLSYEIFVGPIPNGYMVCHRCDTPLCVNPDHLFVGSPKDNTVDMIRKGRKYAPSGEKHHNSKVTDAERLEIARLRSEGWLLNDLARRFGICFQQVSTICAKWGNGDAARN